MNQPKPTPSTQLTLISRAGKALAQATSLSEIKRIRDTAEAVRHYAQCISDGLDLLNQAAETKLRAERKAGQLLAGLALHGGDHKSSSYDGNLTLAELGIDKHQSSSWQQVAAVPDDEFERYLAETKAARRELSTAGLRRVARRLGLVRPYRSRHAASVFIHPAGPWPGGAHARVAPLRPFEPRREELRCGLEGPREESLQEAKNHVAQLRIILDSFCASGRIELYSIERRQIPRLLAETEELLQMLS